MSEWLDKLIPILVTALTSGIMALVRWVSPKFKALPAWLQETTLGFIGVTVAFVAQWAGTSITGAPGTWTEATIQGIVAAVAAHFIYRKGKASVTEGGL